MILIAPILQRSPPDYFETSVLYSRLGVSPDIGNLELSIVFKDENAAVGEKTLKVKTIICGTFVIIYFLSLLPHLPPNQTNNCKNSGIHYGLGVSLIIHLYLWVYIAEKARQWCFKPRKYRVGARKWILGVIIVIILFFAPVLPLLTSNAAN